jgi:antibiotic biosynthesis monooxygenase (ABM) superfamily enzyme
VWSAHVKSVTSGNRSDGAGVAQLMVTPLSGSFDTDELPRIAPHPVTVTVARTVQPGWEAEFLRWADELVQAARHSPGCLGAAVLSPGAPGGEYQIVARFNDGVHLRQWERSAERHELMDRADRFVTGTRVQRVVGVEEWFDAGEHAPPASPTWRRLTGDIVWIYPVSLAITVLVAPWYGSLPLAARVLAGVALATVLVQVVVGPTRRRLRRLRKF